MKLQFLTTTLFAAVLIMPSMTIAGGHTVDKFMEADADKNGLVSKEEYIIRYEAKFGKMDVDEDGNVSPEEYETYIHSKYEEKRKQSFDSMDTNKDGMLSYEEMSEGKKSWGHKH